MGQLVIFQEEIGKIYFFVPLGKSKLFQTPCGSKSH